MIEFIDDDLGYLAWVAAHPDGYVLNVRRSPDPHYVVLHQANCTTISNEIRAPGAFTARSYRKICMSSEGMVPMAAKREGRSDGTPSKRCGHCLRQLTWFYSIGVPAGRGLLPAHPDAWGAQPRIRWDR
jgi:hypothetical protein